MNAPTRRGLSIALRLSLAYCFFSCCWIIFSGEVAESMAGGDPRVLGRIEHLKGICFVIVSTVFLYYLSRGLYRKQKVAGEAYRAVAEKAEAVALATSDGIYEFNYNTDTITINNNMKRMLGLDSTVINGSRRFWEENIHPDDRSRVLTYFDNARSSGTRFARAEYRGRTTSGEYVHVLHTIYALQDTDPARADVVGYVQDISELRKLQVLYHERELRQKNELALSIIKAEERERNRWAEELHDNISQLLSVANLYTSSLTNAGADIPETAGRIREMIGFSIQEIRRLSANLKPPSFQEAGLQQVIRTMLNDVSKVQDIRFDIIPDELHTAGMTEEQQLMIYRIIQESVNNIIRYANATEVVIAIYAGDNEASVRITDNGDGADLSTLREGTGIRNIRSRLGLFGGRMEIKTSPGKGFEMYATFSL